MRRRFFQSESGGVVDKKNYLRFNTISYSTIALTSKTSPDIQYSIDGCKTWIDWDYSSISLHAGTTMYMKGNNPNGFNTSFSSYNCNIFSISGDIEARGNIMSLLYGDDFEENLTIPCDCCFNSLFSGCYGLTTAPELPAMVLTSDCYNSMFQNCSSLTTAPELPATTLADYCYYYMFAGCTSLTTAPELPAMVLGNRSYGYMFTSCTSLTTAPELPATTLASDCYSGMFYNCSNLITSPSILPALTLRDYCYSNMFQNCRNLKTSPILPASTLDIGCYNSMFYGCSYVDHITMLATNISAKGCLNEWLLGVSYNGVFTKHPNMTSLPTGSSGIPNSWEIEDYII